MKIRKATEKDLNEIEKIYEKIHDGEEKGLTTTGWIRGVYPTRQTAEAALKRDDLFVMEDGGVVVASGIINQVQVDKYVNASWKYAAKDEEVMVLHCLTVDPAKSSKGYGRAFISFYEDYARQHNCTVLRIDTNMRNERPRKLYNRIGFEEAGIVVGIFNGIPDVHLVCFEKRVVE